MRRRPPTWVRARRATREPGTTSVSPHRCGPGEYLEQEAPVDQEQAAFQVQALQETWQGDAEERTPDRTIALEAWDEDEALARTGTRG